MTSTGFGLLSLITFFPLAGALYIATLSKHACACLRGEPIPGCDRSLHELRVKMWPGCR